MKVWGGGSHLCTPSGLLRALPPLGDCPLPAAGPHWELHTTLSRVGPVAHALEHQLPHPLDVDISRHRFAGPGRCQAIALSLAPGTATRGTAHTKTTPTAVSR